MVLDDGSLRGLGRRWTIPRAAAICEFWRIAALQILAIAPLLLRFAPCTASKIAKPAWLLELFSVSLGRAKCSQFFDQDLAFATGVVVLLPCLWQPVGRYWGEAAF